jgi:hypothetical protein
LDGGIGQRLPGVVPGGRFQRRPGTGDLVFGAGGGELLQFIDKFSFAPVLSNAIMILNQAFRPKTGGFGPGDGKITLSR